MVLFVQFALSLSFSDICQVKLIDCSVTNDSSAVGLFGSGWNTRARGSIASNTPGACRSARCDVWGAKNHRRSCTMGPPIDGATVQLRSTSVPDARPRSIRSWSRLSACSAGNVNVVKAAPLNWLPPSRGIMLMETPPVSTSAELAE